jgi:hypothetical protein
VIEGIAESSPSTAARCRIFPKSRPVESRSPEVECVRARCPGQR